MRITINVDGHDIQIQDGAYTNGNLETEAAREFARHLIAMLSEMKKYAAENLMDAYDSLWPEDEHVPLTIEEFVANLTAPQIFIRRKLGSASVNFDDAGMFRDDFSLWVAIVNGKIIDVGLE